GPRIREEYVCADRCCEAEAAPEEAVIDERGTVRVARPEQVHRVDQAERGVGYKLARFNGPRVLVGEYGRGVTVGQGTEHRVRVADRRAEIPKRLAGDGVRRPVVRPVGSLMAAVIFVGRRADTKCVEVAEQIIPVLDAESSNPVGRRPWQVSTG